MRPDPRRLLLCSLFVPILMAPPPLEALLLDIVKMRESAAVSPTVMHAAIPGRRINFLYMGSFDRFAKIGRDG